MENNDKKKAENTEIEDTVVTKEETNNEKSVDTKKTIQDKKTDQTEKESKVKEAKATGEEAKPKENDAHREKHDENKADADKKPLHKERKKDASSRQTIEEKRQKESKKITTPKRSFKEFAKKIFTNINTYFIMALAISMVVFIANLISFQILPLRYVILLGLVFVLLLTGLCWILFSKRIAKINRILTNVLISVITILFCVGSWYFQQANQAIDHITIEAGDKEYEIISVVVRKDNPAEELKDVEDGTFAIAEKIDVNNTKQTLEDIKKQLKHEVNTKAYTSMNEVAGALLDKEVDAMILNEAYRSLLDEEHPKFDNDTKVIYTFKIEKEVKKIGSQVDVNRDSYNIYISGIDTYGPIATKSRSDVNMIATVNPQTHKILLTSIPRDYYVAQTCQGNQYDKLTHTGIFGVDCTVESVENLLGITINYYGRVNFSSLENIVDAIGGIDVYNEIGFYSGVDGTLIPAGYLHMYGNTALKFARERHAYADGDRQRGRNQMIVLEAILDQAMSPAIITGYSGIMDAVSNNFQTNMTKEEMTSIIRRQINEGGDWTFTQQSVNGEGSTDWCPANGTYSYVMIPDQTTLDAAIAQIQNVMKESAN